MLIINTNFPSPELDVVLFAMLPVLFQMNTPLQLIELYKKITKCVQKKRDAKKNKSLERMAENGKQQLDAEQVPMVITRETTD